ncbi:MAG TPA: hypothetical protein VME46_13100 [Acidimicrobiales bacterium]|nr:hypothetical protein [Acidimicrobiales bacterium]
MVRSLAWVARPICIISVAVLLLSAVPVQTASALATGDAITVLLDGVDAAGSPWVRIVASGTSELDCPPMCVLTGVAPGVHLSIFDESPMTPSVPPSPEYDLAGWKGCDQVEGKGSSSICEVVTGRARTVTVGLLFRPLVTVSFVGQLLRYASGGAADVVAPGFDDQLSYCGVGLHGQTYCWFHAEGEEGSDVELSGTADGSPTGDGGDHVRIEQLQGCWTKVVDEYSGYGRRCAAHVTSPVVALAVVVACNRITQLAHPADCRSGGAGQGDGSSQAEHSFYRTRANTAPLGAPLTAPAANPADDAGNEASVAEDALASLEQRIFQLAQAAVLTAAPGQAYSAFQRLVASTITVNLGAAANGAKVELSASIGGQGVGSARAVVRGGTAHMRLDLDGSARGAFSRASGSPLTLQSQLDQAGHDPVVVTASGQVSSASGLSFSLPPPPDLVAPVPQLGPPAPPTTTPASIAVSSVAFHGTPAQPMIVVTGKGFGDRPVPSPSYTPAGHSYCPAVAGNDGLDYGTSLWLSGPGKWSAGRYRPELNELDCIGLILVSYSTTAIVFRLGAYYQDPKLAKLTTGSSYTLGVGGFQRTGTVSYTR